ncbi:hypothetical protein PQX77_009491 [Marasmius sp. AFHP31]|nr:hypothetical protein PQX77_009491 [Marasmius sp. AFHP31]
MFQVLMTRANFYPYLTFRPANIYLGELVKREETIIPRESAKKRRARPTDYLSTMPHDVVLEICARLPPADLLNMTSLSKLYRNTLLSKGYRSLWILKRRSLGLPEPPLGFGEVQWTNLLVGPWTSWRCRASKAETVVFAPVTRLCPQCCLEITVSKAALLSKYNNKFGITKRGKAKRVMGLVHPVPADVLPGRGTRYPLLDVQLVLSKLASCKNGQERLSYVHSRRKIIVREKMCGKQLAEYESPLVNSRYEDVKRRILDLGHNEVDYLSMRCFLRGRKPLAEQEWRDKEILMHVLIHHARLRCASQIDNPVVHRRYTMFTETWKRILLSPRPIEARSLPTPFDIIDKISPEESVSRLIVARDNVSVTQGDFDNFKEEILQTMYRIRRESERDLLYFCEEHPVVISDKASLLYHGLTPLPFNETLYSACHPEVFEALGRMAVVFDPLLWTPDQMDARRDVFRCTSHGSSEPFDGPWCDWLSHVYFRHQATDWTDIAFKLVPGRQDTESFGLGRVTTVRKFR